MTNYTIKQRLYTRMLRIRRVEEAIAIEYPKKEMRCPVHLSIGQEAVPVGICELLSSNDRVYSTHRCHAHYLGKGGDLNAMIAELFGKATGCCKGKGGSMHLVDRSVGMMGSSALVGGTIPMAVGSALALKRDELPFVSIAFFGDGATEEGIFYESMNFASLQKLPVIFAVENNQYATYSHQSARQADVDILKRGKAFSIPSERVDGNDVLQVMKASRKAIERARSGGGPTLFEFTTYRYRDHVGPNYDVEIGYRTQSEVDRWMKQCPIDRLETQMRKKHRFSDEDKARIESEIKQEIDHAFALARKAPYPELKEIFTDIYAQP